MKHIREFDPQTVRRLIEAEGWHEPLAEVRRVKLTPRQKLVFWGLRAYVLLMTAVVVWSFVHAGAR